MSYSIYLNCPTCKEAPDYSLNYTSNLQPFFVWALGGKGLRDLNGLTCEAAEKKLKLACFKASSTDVRRFDADNGWGTGAGALNLLIELRALCKEKPQSIVEVSC